jgi:hypothetical protein
MRQAHAWCISGEGAFWNGKMLLTPTLSPQAGRGSTPNVVVP